MSYKLHSQKNTKIYIAYFILGSAILMLYTIYLNRHINIANDNLLSWGAGWHNHQSLYSGSELGFIVSNTDIISAEFIRNANTDQGLEMIIDGKYWSKDTVQGEYSILTAPVDPKKRHIVIIRHFCTYLYDPCDISIKKIVIKRKGKLLPYSVKKPIMSVLGDSISTMYGPQNFTRILADTTGHQLHNASIMGSSITQIPNVDSVSMRYEKDLRNIQSDSIIIFLGTNDVKNNTSRDTFYKQYSDMIMNIRNWNATAHIFLLGILPRKDIPEDVINAYNNLIKQIADSYNMYFIDTSLWITYDDLSDDIHPSLHGQRKLYEKFLPIFRSINK